MTDHKNKPLDETLGARIRECRIRKGLTQIDLADGLCTPSMISQIESGRARPSYKILKAISERLDVSIDKLMANEDFDLELTSLYKMADAMTSDHEYGAAIPLFQKLLHENYLRVPPRVLRFKLGVCYRSNSQLKEAEELLGKVYEDAIIFADHDLQVDCLLELGHLQVSKSDFILANSYYEKALSVNMRLELKDPMKEAQIFVYIADVYSKIGRSARALEYFEKARKLWEQFEQPETLAKSFLTMADQFFKVGDFKSSIKFAERSSSIFRSIDDTLSTAMTNVTIADAFVREARLDDAVEQLNMALGIYQSCGDRAQQGEVHARLAHVYFLKGNDQLALEMCELARSLMPENTHGMARVFAVRGDVAITQDRMDQAKMYFEKAAQIYQNHQDYRSWREVMTKLSEVLSRQGDLRGALEMKEEIVQRMEEWLRNMGVSY